MIKVGAATETALKERKHRIEDAVSATRAAVEEGIVPGGGSALMQAAEALADGLGLTGDEATGVAIVRKALRAPLYWIAANGGQEGAVVINKVAERAWGQGFNAATLTYGDLLADGVVDPVKVTRSAVVNAASIARMVLTTESAVVDKPEPPAPAPGGAVTGTGTVTDRVRTPVRCGWAASARPAPACAGSGSAPGDGAGVVQRRRGHPQPARAPADDLVAFGLRQPAPHPVGLVHRQRVPAALLQHRAASGRSASPGPRGSPGRARARPRDGRRSRCPSRGRRRASASPRCPSPEPEAFGCPPSALTLPVHPRSAPTVADVSTVEPRQTLFKEIGHDFRQVRSHGAYPCADATDAAPSVPPARARSGSAEPVPRPPRRRGRDAPRRGPDRHAGPGHAARTIAAVW